MAEEVKPVPPTAQPAPAESTPAKPAETRTSESIGQPQGSRQQSAPTDGGGGLGGLLLPVVGFLAMLYFLMIRPENKRRKEQQDMLSGMKKNDKVVLASSGIYGLVREIDGDDVVVQIDPKNNTCVRVRKEFIGTIVSDKKEEKK